MQFSFRAPTPAKPTANKSPSRIAKLPPEAARPATLEEVIAAYAEKSFALIADGDGMRNAGIFAGDCLSFVKAHSAVDGDIIIAIVNGTPMCRRFFHEGDKARIRREDGETPDVITSDCRILGVLVRLSRDYKKAV